jgi:hypothetical protein
MMQESELSSSVVLEEVNCMNMCKRGPNVRLVRKMPLFVSWGLSLVEYRHACLPSLSGSNASPSHVHDMTSSYVPVSP